METARLLKGRTSLPCARSPSAYETGLPDLLGRLSASCLMFSSSESRTFWRALQNTSTMSASRCLQSQSHCLEKLFLVLGIEAAQKVTQFRGWRLYWAGDREKMRLEGHLSRGPKPLTAQKATGGEGVGVPVLGSTGTPVQAPVGIGADVETAHVDLVARGARCPG